jgi:aldose 1-epimerase
MSVGTRLIEHLLEQVEGLKQQNAVLKPWGFVDGEAVHRINLRSSSGLQASVITLGATLSELHVPDSNGKSADVVLGFDSCDEYAGPQNPFFGCTVGRLSGRTNPLNVSIDGKEYHLQANDGGGGGIDTEHTNLHGGKKGFNKYVWKIEEYNASSVTLYRQSPAGEEGFPGTLDIRVQYSLRGNELWIKYDATTTEATPVSLTNHTYFDLSDGQSRSKTMMGHELQLNCSKYNPDDASGNGVPTGEFVSVEGTCRDFRNALHPLHARVHAQADDTPIWPHGEQFVVDAMEGKEAADFNGAARQAAANSAALPVAAVLRDPESGRTLTISTSEPVVQTYYSTLMAPLKGKRGRVYEKYAAICLETHRHANALHCPQFPSVILQPGETYSQLTKHAFTA